MKPSIFAVDGDFGFQFVGMGLIDAAAQLS
jgi:hypothetical protein